MPHVLFDFVVDSDQTHLAPAFSTPALRKTKDVSGQNVKDVLGLDKKGAEDGPLRGR